jgi:hypothetical protein
MRDLSRWDARDMGRAGGLASPTAGRRGDSVWGRSMLARLGQQAQQKHYPGFSKVWARNANRARWDYRSSRCPRSTPPAAIRRRRERNAERQRREYDAGLAGREILCPRCGGSGIEPAKPRGHRRG